MMLSIHRWTIMADPRQKPIKRPKTTPNKGQSSKPGAQTSRGSEITNNDARYTFKTGEQLITDIKSGNATTAVRAMARTSDSIVSSDVKTKATIANSGHKVTAYDALTGEFSAEATTIAASVLKSLGRVYDYTKGFVTKPSISEVIHRMLVDTQLTGAPMAELVMDKDRLPDYINTIAYDYIRKISRGDGTWFPRQALPQQTEVDLDFPNIFVSEMSRDSGSAYCVSPILAAVPDIFDLRVFKDDMERAVRRQGHGRLLIEIDYQAIAESMPDEVRKLTPAEQQSWMESIRAGIQDVVDDLRPEDALVSWDTAKARVEDGSGSRADYKPILESKQGSVATGLNSSPSALGMRLQGSQSLSNTESLIYIKQCEGLQKPVADVMSRLLTFACRILGMDVTVDFEFLPINLRPKDELEAFESSKQNRLMDALSIGVISDELYYHLANLPPMPTSLSGTMFRSGGSQGVPETTTGPQENALQPDKDVPRRGGGRDQ